MTEPSVGHLVVLDGIDGAGKSSVGVELARQLAAEGTNTAFVPRGTPAASADPTRRLRCLADLLWDYRDDIDLNSLGDRHLILLMASWFALFDASVLRPALLRHRIVITDQSPHKYIARFLAKGHTDVAQLFTGLWKANLVLHLEVNVETAAGRKGALRNTECGGSGIATVASFASFQQRVRAELLSLRDASWTSIDADNALCDVVAAAAAVTRNRCLGKFGGDHP